MDDGGSIVVVVRAGLSSISAIIDLGFSKTPSVVVVVAILLPPRSLRYTLDVVNAVALVDRSNILADRGAIVGVCIQDNGVCGSVFLACCLLFRGAASKM